MLDVYSTEWHGQAAIEQMVREPEMGGMIKTVMVELVMGQAVMTELVMDQSVMVELAMGHAGCDGATSDKPGCNRRTGWWNLQWARL